MSKERENWVRLCLLREASVDYSRQLFRDIWSNTHNLNPSGEPWENTPENGATLWGVLEAANAKFNFVKFEPHEKAFIVNGDSENWELQILEKVLRCLGIPDVENLAMFLRIVFAGILKEETCDSAKLENKMEQVIPLLSTRAGFDAAKILKANIASVEKHLKLMDILRKGNMLRIFKNNKKKAIETFGEAVGIADNDNDETLVISSILGTAFDLAETDAESAKQSGKLLLALAERKIKIQPDSWQSYSDLGKVHKLLGNRELAIEALNKALELNPVRSDVITLKDEMIGRKDPIRLISLEESLQMANKQIGMNVTPKHVLKAEQKFKNSKNPASIAYGYLIEGNRYDQGFAGIKKDYKKAAEIYEKAVKLGNAEAMYNLSRLYRDGRGVKKDLKKSAMLLEQAVKVPNLSEEDAKIFGLSPDDAAPGVACAMLALGEYYDQGLHVPKSGRMAVKLFFDALENGNDAAGFYIGNYYEQGVFLERNLEKAAQYWKMAADLGHGPSMAQLAEYSLVEEGNIEMAKEWFRRAKDNSIVDKEGDRMFQEQVKETKKKIEELRKMELEAGIQPEPGAKLNDRLSRALSATNGTDEKSVHEMINLLSKKHPHPEDNKLAIDYAMVRSHAERGSPYAKQMALAFKHYNRTISLIVGNMLQGQSNNDEEIIHELAAFYRTDCEFVTGFTAEIFTAANAAVKRVLSKSVPREQEIDARICHQCLNLTSLDRAFAAGCVKKFPEEVRFWAVYIAILAFSNDCPEGAKQGALALRRFPNDVELLFASASSIRLSKGSWSHYQESIRQYEKFIKLAPSDHRKIPEAYYCIAYMYMCCTDSPDGNREMALAYMEKGKEAERRLMPCFLPYDSMAKKSTELFLTMKENTGTKQKKAVPKVEPKAESSIRTTRSMTVLTNPIRIKIVLAFRKQAEIIRGVKKESKYLTNFSLQPPKNQSAPLCPKMTKPITLKEMDASKDRVYKGRQLKLTCIEDGFRMTSLMFVGEDENGDVQRVCFFGTPDGDPRLTYASKVTILNPYMRIAGDGLPAIRVDDPASIVYHKEEYDPDRCRFCGSGGAGFKCGKCYRAKYCTKECQMHDWKIMKHSLICFD